MIDVRRLHFQRFLWRNCKSSLGPSEHHSWDAIPPHKYASVGHTARLLRGVVLCRLVNTQRLRHAGVTSVPAMWGKGWVISRIKSTTTSAMQHLRQFSPSFQINLALGEMWSMCRLGSPTLYSITVSYNTAIHVDRRKLWLTCRWKPPENSTCSFAKTCSDCLIREERNGKTERHRSCTSQTIFPTEYSVMVML